MEAWGIATPLDGVVLAILLIAVLRGLFRGLIREAFSIGALAGACLAVRFGTAPLAEQLGQLSDGAIGPGAAPWVAGILIAIAAVGLIAMVGRMARRGADAVGLGFLDRLGGGALGAAEGALLCAVLLLAALWLIGREHPLLEHSRSLEAFEELRVALEERGARLPDVATPPPRYSCCGGSGRAGGLGLRLRGRLGR